MRTEEAVWRIDEFVRRGQAAQAAVDKIISRVGKAGMAVKRPAVPATQKKQVKRARL
jgi:hypothetical protein